MQICLHVSSDNTIPAGDGVARTGTYAAAFSTRPIGAANIPATVVSRFKVNFVPSSDGLSFSIYSSNTGVTLPGTLYYIAIGRWYEVT